MLTLGCDPGWNNGWCLLEDDQALGGGTIAGGAQRGNFDLKLLKSYRLSGARQPDLVGIERGNADDATTLLIEEARSVCFRHEIEVMVIEPVKRGIRVNSPVSIAPEANWAPEDQHQRCAFFTALEVHQLLRTRQPLAATA